MRVLHEERRIIRGPLPASLANGTRSCAENTAVLDILLITFPFFALVLCGFAGARLRLLPLEAIPGLNTFVLYFALPCMLYRFGSTTPIAQLLDAAAIAVYLVCALVMVTFVVTASMNRRIGWNDASFGALVASFPNTGFMGVPLLVALLGTAAAGPAILTILVDLLVTTSLCIALSRLDGAGQDGVRDAAKNALKAVVANPMPWAIILGGLASAWQFKPIAPVLQTLELLADAASPVALFTIGAVLARAPMLSAATQQATNLMPLRDYLPVAVIKLVVHPALVLLVGATAIHLGLPLDRFALTVMVLVAALPSASNVSVLAEKFGADNNRIARIILLTTAAAFLTFSGAVALVN